MANDIVQTIAEARVDAQSLSEFVFKPAGFKVARRLAPTVDTLQFYIDRFNSLNGDFSSSVSVALSSLNTSVAEADGKVAYIETTVQDAINNTAIEGGVLADTFVTVTVKGAGSVARTQRDKNADTFNVKDFIAPQAAIDYVGSIGGGEILFGAGEYVTNLEISAPNITLIGEGRGSVLRATLTSRSKSNVRVFETATNFRMKGFTLAGQSVEKELAGNSGGTVDNTDSLHGLFIQAPDAIYEDIYIYGNRQDNIYISVANGEGNLTFNDVICAGAARNPLSIIKGTNIVFNGGKSISTDKYTYGGSTGTYIVDIEPNYDGEFYDELHFNNYQMIVDHIGNPAEKGLVILVPNNESRMGRVTFNSCTFGKTARSDYSAKFRCSPREDKVDGTRWMGNFALNNCTLHRGIADNAQFITTLWSSADDVDLYGVTINDFTVHGSIGSLAYGHNFKKDCTLSNLKVINADGTANTSGLPTAREASNISPYRPANLPYGYGTQHHRVLESRLITIQSADFVNLLTFGFRGGAKVTIVGADASSGAYGLHFSETYYVASPDNVAKAVNVHIDHVNGLEVKFESTSATGTAGIRRLQVKKKHSGSELYVVTLEEFAPNGLLGTVWGTEGYTYR